MDVQITQDKILVKFPYDRSIVDRVNKNGLGMKWDKRRRIWHHPLTYPFAQAFVEEFPEEAPEILCELAQPTLPINQWQPSAYLMDHQKKAAQIAAQYNRYAFFDETGTGKTVEGLEIWKQKRVKTIVVCPLSIIENAWIEDCERFCPEINIINLWDLRRRRNTKTGKVAYQKNLDECDIAVINFESFRLMDGMDGFQMLLIDESSKCKNPKAKTTKALIKYADTVPYVYLFSGTPAPNSELEYYPQVRMLDQRLFSSSFYQFRAEYFRQTGFGGFEWKMLPNKRPVFLKKLATVSRVVRKHDVLDLPEKTVRLRKVWLTKTEKQAYDEMERHMIIEFEDQDVLAANAAVKLMKLRQGSAGFFLDETGGVQQTGTSKLDELESLLEEIGDHQIIIWTQFHYEADQIQKMLGDNCVRADGTVNQDNKNEAIKKFKNGEVKYFVGHPASVGHGITLTNCSYVVYFSLSYSYELQAQSMDRIYRKGQRNACTYYYLIAVGTVDEVIVKALDLKKGVAESVFNYIKEKGGR